MRIHLIHWNQTEAKGRVAALRKLGFKVSWSAPKLMAALRPLRLDPPDAILIDLTRLPSSGREIARALREYKTTRLVPLVFVEGEAEKVRRITRLFPDATYGVWRSIGSSVRRAVARPPKDPVRPGLGVDTYGSVPLVRKLGIKQGHLVELGGAPAGFEDLLGPLPSGARTTRLQSGAPDLRIWFSKSRTALERKLDRSRGLETGLLWIAWPKRTSGVASDLDQATVRRLGLDRGFVDFKVCKIDETWSSLLFQYRKINPRS